MCGQTSMDKSGGFLLSELLEWTVKMTEAQNDMSVYARQTTSTVLLVSGALTQQQTFFSYLLKEMKCNYYLKDNNDLSLSFSVLCNMQYCSLWR